MDDQLNRSAIKGLHGAALGDRYRAGAPSVPLSPEQQRTKRLILENDRQEDWEESPCLCGQTSGLLISEIDRHGLPYPKLLCMSCGLLRTSPRWNAHRYATFYEIEYRALYKPTQASKEGFFNTVVASSSVRNIAAWVVRSAERMGIPSPMIVEIGTGGGWNLINLPPSWKRIGFDVDEEYLTLGRKAGIDMRRGFVDSAVSSGCVTDANLVLLSHVVEHFIDPVTELLHLKYAMGRDALLLIEVPGVFRVHSSSQDPMRLMQNAHIHTFCAATLAALCERAGYQVLQIDETVRAVCRPIFTTSVPTFKVKAGPMLARKMLRYLKSCESGAKTSLRLRRVPLVGRVLSALFRRLWFPAIGLLHRL